MLFFLLLAFFEGPENRQQLNYDNDAYCGKKEEDASGAIFREGIPETIFLFRAEMLFVLMRSLLRKVR